MTDSIISILREQRVTLAGQLAGLPGEQAPVVAALLDALAADGQTAELTRLAQSLGAWHAEQGSEPGDWLQPMGRLRAAARRLLYEQGTAASELLVCESRWDQVQAEFLAVLLRAYIERLRQQLTERDPLTKLLNRAAFDRQLQDEVARARRYQRALTLIMLDLDRFKQINDCFGHLTGDGVLQQFAQFLQASLRRSDAAFRYGGDEFAALLPETSPAAAEQVLRRLEQGLQAQLLFQDEARTIGISYGIASYPADAVEAVELLGRADARLYECKRRRQRLVLASPV
jgi:diguanylate cyclase (GGDEF)-like protein